MFKTNTIKISLLATLLSIVGLHSAAYSRDVEYNGGEVAVFVAPGEPTQLRFPGNVSGGFKKSGSKLTVDPQGSDLIVFAQASLPEDGEVVIVRLEDSRSFSVRVKPVLSGQPRDDLVTIDDLTTGQILGKNDEDDAPYQEKKFDYAPPTMVSGLVREMMLAAEFGKSAIPGYRISDRHKGETILHDGTLHAKIDRIFLGATLWGYVIDAENLLESSQIINPATFRIDGTHAVSANRWEVAPRPLTVEQEIAAKHKSKIYIVTRAK